MKVAAGFGGLLSASLDGCVNERSRGIGLLPIICPNTFGPMAAHKRAELFTGLLRDILQF